MAVTPEAVRAVAELARLRLQPDEVRLLTAQLNDILAHMEALAAAPADLGNDPEAGGPDGAVVGEGQALRQDEVGPDPLALPVRDMAPGWEAGFFTVPRLASHDVGPDDPGRGVGG